MLQISSGQHPAPDRWLIRLVKSGFIHPNSCCSQWILSIHSTPLFGSVFKGKPTGKPAFYGTLLQNIQLMSALVGERKPTVLGDPSTFREKPKKYVLRVCPRVADVRDGYGDRGWASHPARRIREKGRLAKAAPRPAARGGRVSRPMARGSLLF